MKLKIKNVIYVSLFVYILLTPFREIVTILSTNLSFDTYLEGWTYLLISTSWFSMSLYSILAYYLLYKYYPNRPIIHLVFILIIVSPIIIFFRYFIQEIVFDWLFGATNYNRNYTIGAYLLDNIYYSVIYYSLGIVVFFVQWASYSASIQHDLELQRNKAELSLLRSQLNPHFLFNMLNNIYSMINQKSEKSKDAVMKLSQLLRYSLYEEGQFVTVAQEWEYMNDYIEVQQYRFNSPLSLSMKLDPQAVKLSIPPFILIPFVENIFKHGDVTHKDHPFELSIEKINNELIFKSKNLIKPQEKDTVGGIGLENTKKRLELIYGSRHTLTIISDQYYTVELKVIVI